MLEISGLYYKFEKTFYVLIKLHLFCKIAYRHFLCSCYPEYSLLL
jgi:hypothetical protein